MKYFKDFVGVNLFVGIMFFVFFVVLHSCITGCGTNNKVTGGTTNTVTIEHRVPMCEDNDIYPTKEDKHQCVVDVNTVRIETDDVKDIIGDMDLPQQEDNADVVDAGSLNLPE